MLEPRIAKPTVSFIDDYCALYRSLFPEVRSFEAFKHLHVGMIADIKRKSLPAIARVVGLENEQSLHHFLTASPWSTQALREHRLQVILEVLKGQAITLIIDETGDRKKGQTTAYVKRQYIGNLGKIENGIVAVTAYGVWKNMTLPLTFEVYKPHTRLEPGDVYQSKPQIAAQMIRALQAIGFEFQLVLADSLYGESENNFVRVLQELKLEFAVAIRRDHGMILPPGQRIRYNRWRTFERVFAVGKPETRYIREIIFGQRRAIQYWQITTDPTSLLENATWYVMTQIEGLNYHQVGNYYGLRNWVEYGLKQSKNELGWADFRVTDYAQVEKWWEIVMSAYLMVSLHADVFNANEPTEADKKMDNLRSIFSIHPWWDPGKGWKNLLNNLRLIIQPFISFNLIKPWLTVFPIQELSVGFSVLMKIMNLFKGATPRADPQRNFQFLYR